MTRTGGRHHISRRTKLATLGAAVAIAAGAVVVVTTTGDDEAYADGVDKSLFVDITKVKPNVKAVNKQGNASKGTFTVNCGTNRNGHFNGDNFIAAPGVENGAQHLHDYVGNLSTNAKSNDKSLLAAGTTCRNGDKSAYFWPVIRIDTADEEAENKVDQNAPKVDDKAAIDKDVAANDDSAAALPETATQTANPPAKVEERKAQAAEDKKDQAAPRVACPDIASKLEDVPDAAVPEVSKQLDKVDKVADDADKKLAAETVDAPKVNDKAVVAPAKAAEVLDPLEDQRKAALDKIIEELKKLQDQIADLQKQIDALKGLDQCGIKDGNNPAPIPDGSENSETPPAQTPPAQEEENENNELPGNDGVIQRPEKAEITFRGSPVGKVTAMPKFLRVLYGDAKISINGTKNARDSWTCSGFEDKVQIKQYPICPRGAKVKRIHDFPSCWDGKNTDSANHRTHIVFPDPNTGKCGQGFKAVPQLRITLTYNIPRDIQRKGQYKVDSFPTESHNPVSDHDDFANVMSQSIMNRLVNCINRGKTCRE
ncbi:DUF1996 domain-containing protein [Umezawaea tangerina]|uniref:Uncharacterized protein DUF1996 n=1 Tax=Umezawaea tangerina TaxID=84725 RepID=A0A2T0TGP8_9PSEU|nr:DUF1996 domain-containing protein [Umezawaea tangerina]PRY44882.1 uncharacterized protein DUF1996 [Umezawaea tangerina]